MSDPRSRNKAKGKEIERKGRRIIAAAYDAYQFSQKAVKFVPGKGPFTLAEDLLHGTVDAIAIRVGEPTLLVQMTTLDGVDARKRKITDQLVCRLETWTDELDKALKKKWLREHYHLQIWAWVTRRGFRVLPFSWENWTWGRWDDGYLISPPLPKPPKKRENTPHAGASSSE